MTALEIVEHLRGNLTDEDIMFRVGRVIQRNGETYGAVALTYITAATVIRILNDSGLAWSDWYDIQVANTRDNGPNGYMAICKLSIEGVERMDVGEGQFPKDAASDALKRAARKFGIGEELYGGEVLLTPDEFTQSGYIRVDKETLLARWRGDEPNPDIFGGSYASRSEDSGRRQNRSSGGGSNRGRQRLATARQKQLIRNLIEDNPGIFENEDGILETLDEMTMQQASDTIEMMLNRVRGGEF